jgi:acetolactate synthase-1/2/3 large subunit
MPSVAEIIVSRLMEAGVRSLFGMPGGGSNLDLIEAAGRAGLPFVLSHTETAGALMACAQAELTGAPGACLATIGPGVASLVNGAAHARLDRVPLVLLTDAIAAPGRDIYLHQRLDHHAVLAPVTKASITIEADRADEAFSQAISEAIAPPPGPVHVDLSPDISRKETEQAGARAISARSEPGPGQFGALLSTVRRPLVIAGLGVQSAQDANALRGLCERRGIPALVTYKAKGAVPDDHPLFAGVFTNGAIERAIIDQADLVIGVGLDPVEFLPRPWSYRAPCIAVNRWTLDQRHFPLAGSIEGDLAASLLALEESLPPGSDWHASEIAANARQQREALRAPSGGWAPWQVVDAAAQSSAPDTRVTVDAGAHMFPIMGLWPAREPRQILISNGLSTMGFALPSAIGAALIDPTRRVLALTGDGGLLMCLAELGTAAREKANVTVIVFNDRSLSLIDIKQRKMGYPRAGVALDGIDWKSAAATFGVPAWLARNDDEMARAVEEAAQVNGPALIEAVVDPSSYPETLRVVRG